MTKQSEGVRTAYAQGDHVIWYEARKWGGKQNNIAEFVELRGKRSARVKVDGKERTVRLTCIAPLKKVTNDQTN